MLFNRLFLPPVITVDLKAQSTNGKDFEDELLEMLVLCNKGVTIFKSSKTALKLCLLKVVFSNLQIKGEKLKYAMVSPLSECVNIGGIKEWWCVQSHPNYSHTPVRILPQ